MANNNGGGVHDDYLNAPDTAGRPMAFPSLILVFLIIAFLLFALMLGGRWIYQQITDDSSSTVVTNGQSTSSSNGTADSQTDDSSNGAGADQTGDADETNSNIIAGEDSSSTSQSNGGANGVDQDNQGEQQAAASAVTGPETTEVPNTGPGSLLAVFIGATVIGALAHNRWLLRNN